MNDFDTAKQKAIKYIGISKKTKKEVKTKLTSLNFTNEIIDKTIDFLVSLEYINDKVYVRAYVNQNIRFLKYSTKEIKNKLYLKGINLEDYDEYYSLLVDSDYEKNVVNKLQSSKCKNMDEISLKKYLYRRGFKEELI